MVVASRVNQFGVVPLICNTSLQSLLLTSIIKLSVSLSMGANVSGLRGALSCDLVFSRLEGHGPLGGGISYTGQGNMTGDIFPTAGTATGLVREIKPNSKHHIHTICISPSYLLG